MKILVNVSRLPKPPYPPTVTVRTIEKPERIYEDYDYNQKNGDKLMEQRMRRAAEARKKYAEKYGYTAEQEQEIIDLYKQGYTLKEISEKMGKSESAVKQKIDRLKKIYSIKRDSALRRHYVRRKPESEIVRKGHYTPAQDAVILEMRAQGKTYKEIADHLGRSRDAIRHRVKIIS